MQIAQKIANCFFHLNKYPDRNELILNFCDEWAKCADKQSFGEYTEYYKIYEEIINITDASSIDFVEDQVSHVCSSFLSSANQISIQRGFELIFSAYEKISANEGLRKNFNCFLNYLDMHIMQ